MSDTKKKKENKLPSTETRKIYEALSAPLPEKAVERTEGSKTGKGYNTTGYKYQFVINRLNEVLGIGNWGYEIEVVKEEVMLVKERNMYSISVDAKVWLIIDEKETPKLRMSGGHKSRTYADAKKGAITNSLKKGFALFGVGKQAYEITIDDDNSSEAPSVCVKCNKVPPYPGFDVCQTCYHKS